MADTPKQDNTPPQAEPVIMSAQSIKQVQTDKLEKDRKDLIQKQLKQGVTDDKNSKNLVKTLVQIGTVLKGVLPDKNKKQPGVVGKNESGGSIGSVIKGALSDGVKGRTDGLKSLVSVKGIAGLAAAKYAGDPTSIMGSVFSRVHEHLDSKDKAEQEKNDFRKGFAGGTDVGREMYGNIKKEKFDQLKLENDKQPQKKRKSDTDLEKSAHDAAINDSNLQKEADKIFNEKKQLEEELSQLQAKAATLKSEGGTIRGKAVFSLSDEEQKRSDDIVNRLGKITRGGELAEKQSAEKKITSVKYEPEAPEVLSADDERDKAMEIYKKNNNLTSLSAQDEKNFEAELARNKEAKIRASDENNKVQLANESVKKAMDEGAYEKMRPEVKERAESLKPSGDAQTNISEEDVDKAKEDFYSNMFKDIMEELNTLSKDQLEELHAIRSAIEGDNKNDAKREAKLDDKADDHLSKIQKMDIEGPDLINQDQLLAGKPILGSEGGKSEKDKPEEKSKGILDTLGDLLGDGKSGKGLLSTLARFAGPALAVAGAGAAGYAAGTAIYESQGENIQDGLGKITGADAKHKTKEDAAQANSDVQYVQKKIAAGEPISFELAEKVRGKIEVPDDLVLKKGQKLDQWKAARAPAPEKPPITPTKEIIDEKQDAVDQAKAAQATPAPSVVNAPTVNNKTTNNNTTITREPIRAEDPNLPWRSALFN